MKKAKLKKIYWLHLILEKLNEKIMKITHFRAIKLKIVNIIGKIRRHYGNMFHTKHITIDVAELFFQHNGDKDFLRYDMIVRLLAVENYYGINDCGMRLYAKMQTAREKAKLPPSIAENRFKELIESYEKNGYNEKSEIELDSSLQLIDGSHRMAMAMYHKQHEIRAKVRPYTLDTYYRIEWFIANDFTDSECLMMRNRYLELKAYYGQPFVCTLWHPARDYFEDITKKLSLFGEIKEVKDFKLNALEYKFFTKGIYAVDDIEKWKIEKKVLHMMGDKDEVYSLRMVCLFLSSPRFRLKQSNNKTLSMECEIIKQIIREAYKPKIRNYFHDIIMHIGDNFYQNKHIYHLLNMPQVNVKSVMESIKGQEYVATKVDAPYMPDDFPLSFPLGKDIDIICNDTLTYKNVVNLIKDNLNEYKKSYIIRVIKLKNRFGSEYRTQIRLEIEGNVLVFLFDVFAENGLISSVFVKDMIAHRENLNGIYVPTLPYEMVVRIKELYDYPKKKHHLDYIKKHQKDINEDLLNKYLKFNWKNVIQ